VVTSLVCLLAMTVSSPARAEPTYAGRHSQLTSELEKSDPTPFFVRLLPDRTRQVVRTIGINRWCDRRWCTVTQLWQQDSGGQWTKVRAFRSTIGPSGFGKRREGDHRSPSGLYRIRVTFSTGAGPPGKMPWKQRLPTSNVTSQAGRLYNTWIEEPWRTDGARALMRWGFIVNYNHPRLAPGVGPKPVAGKGSGIFYHTSLNRQTRWSPTDGCTQLGRRKQMRWVLRWLDPQDRPRVIQGR
jgi:L,D-peptidoglycan transpeptidase YkuD (ErfK/YbiS/YcfS/YnhG family)